MNYEWIAGACCTIEDAGGIVRIKSAISIANQICINRTIEVTDVSLLGAKHDFERAIYEWRKDKTGDYPRHGA